MFKAIGLCPGIALALIGVSDMASAKSQVDPSCAPLKTFVESVKPDETRTVLFRTAWFQPFKDEPGASNMGGRRCEHAGYPPAKAFCGSFLNNSSTEFAGINAMAVIECLAPGVSFRRLQLETIDVSFSHGTDDRGQNVDVSLHEDTKVGGMVMKIKVDGY